MQLSKKIISKTILSSLMIVLIGFYSCDDDDTTTEDTSTDDEVIVPPQEGDVYTAEGVITIENGSGGLDVDLQSGDRFSRDHDKIGDVNGDGVIDLIVGARSDDDGVTDAGAAYVLFMNSDGSVLNTQKISMLEGGFTEILNEGNFFGYGVAGIGDYDLDGVPDIAVSAPTLPNNSLYIILLNADGTVKSYTKNENIVANGLTAIGDLNNDGRIDLVACMPGADDGGTNRGAIEILFMDDNGSVTSRKRISSTEGNFGLGLENGDNFGGREVAMLGDLDNDGNKELAVGAFLSNQGKGAVWILSLDNTTYDVISKTKITDGQSGFTEALTTAENPNGSFGAQLGHAMAAIGDLDGDGIEDLFTSANQQDEGWAYILYFNEDKTVKSFSKINNTEGDFGLVLESEERFGRSISFAGDLKNDGSIAVNVGGGAGGTGTLYVLFLRPL